MNNLNFGLLDDWIAGRAHCEVVVAGPLSLRDFLRVADGRTCIAVNRGLWLKPQAFGHYVSYHSQNMMEIQRGWRGVSWIQQDKHPWGVGFCHSVDNMFSGGSSALFAISVALQYLGATKIFLSGVTLDAEGYHRYRQNWLKPQGVAAQLC